MRRLPGPEAERVLRRGPLRIETAQPVRRVRKSDGITTVQVKWRQGGPQAPPATTTAGVTLTEVPVAEVAADCFAHQRTVRVPRNKVKLTEAVLADRAMRSGYSPSVAGPELEEAERTEADPTAVSLSVA